MLSPALFASHGRCAASPTWVLKLVESSDVPSCPPPSSLDPPCCFHLIPKGGAIAGWRAMREQDPPLPCFIYDWLAYSSDTPLAVRHLHTLVLKRKFNCPTFIFVFLLFYTPSLVFSLSLLALSPLFHSLRYPISLLLLLGL